MCNFDQFNTSQKNLLLYLATSVPEDFGLGAGLPLCGDADGDDADGDAVWGVVGSGEPAGTLGVGDPPASVLDDAGDILGDPLDSGLRLSATNCSTSSRRTPNKILNIPQKTGIRVNLPRKVGVGEPVKFE